MFTHCLFYSLQAETSSSEEESSSDDDETPVKANGAATPATTNVSATALMRNVDTRLFDLGNRSRRCTTETLPACRFLTGCKSGCC